MSDKYKTAINELRLYVAAPSMARMGISRASAHLLLNKLSEHERRAALVAAWADGLRAGKRYAVTVDGREWYAVRRGYWDEHYFAAGVTHATEGIEEIAETSENRTAAYMASISDQWTEVEP